MNGGALAGRRAFVTGAVVFGVTRPPGVRMPTVSYRSMDEPSWG